MKEPFFIKNQGYLTKAAEEREAVVLEVKKLIDFFNNFHITGNFIADFNNYLKKSGRSSVRPLLDKDQDLPSVLGEVGGLWITLEQVVEENRAHLQMKQPNELDLLEWQYLPEAEINFLKRFQDHYQDEVVEG